MDGHAVFSGMTRRESGRQFASKKHDLDAMIANEYRGTLRLASCLKHILPKIRNKGISA